ncbi:hypothetical protein [Methylobacterium oryzae]|uniref:hypothetical protein n=1 Tax=Methylobacterium oryzae TaxID=334852 RepID=UPI002F3580A3
MADGSGSDDPRNPRMPPPLSDYASLLLAETVLADFRFEVPEGAWPEAEEIVAAGLGRLEPASGPEDAPTRLLVLTQGDEAEGQ